MLWAPFLLVPVIAFQPAQAAVEVRVGVVAYQDFDGTATDIERLFDELAKSIDKAVRFRLAVGTYGDVLHWLGKKQIDIALLTPGAFVESLKANPAGEPICDYLASKLLPAKTGDESTEGTTTARDGYRAVCVVALRSPLRTIDDVRRAWSAGRAHFVFVDPLSASGHIAPVFALKQARIEPAPAEVEYSYSHTNSLRMLESVGGGPQHVAFVWDGAWQQSRDLPAWRKIDFPQLDELTVPADMVVARTGFEYGERVIDLLTTHVDENGKHDFQRFEDWRERIVTSSTGPTNSTCRWIATRCKPCRLMD